MGYEVRRMTEYGSRQWGVFLHGQLVEGGFFSFAAARQAAEAWEEGRA